MVEGHCHDIDFIMTITTIIITPIEPREMSRVKVPSSNPPPVVVSDVVVSDVSDVVGVVVPPPEDGGKTLT